MNRRSSGARWADAWQRKRIAEEGAADRHGFGREPVGSKLIPQCQDVKNPDSVDFMAPPVSVTGAAKDLYVSKQVPLTLVLCGLDQYGPIIA